MLEGAPSSRSRYTASTLLRYWMPYVSPEVWRKRSTICIGRAGGVEGRFVTRPPAKTPRPAHSGMKRVTGSSRATAPSSTSIMKASAVKGLVME